MERSEAEGLPLPIHAHPDAAMREFDLTKVPPDIARRRDELQRMWRDNPKLYGGQVKWKEMVVGSGSKEDGMVQPAGKGKKMVVGAGSKKDVMVPPGKKLAKLGLSKQLTEYIRTREVMGIMATETPRPSLLPFSQEELFDCELREQIAAEYEENRELDAYLLYQFRTKGYAEIHYLTDDDDEEV